MPEPTSAAVSDSTPQIERVAVKPKGILPQNMQNWLFLSVGLIVVLVILFGSSGTSAKDKKAQAAAAAASKPLVIAPSQARIQEYRQKIDAEARKLELEQVRLQEVQKSIGAGTNGSPAGAYQAMYPPASGVPNSLQSAAAPAPVDPVRADREKREYASLFASNVALTFRPAATEKVDKPETGSEVKNEHDSAKAQSSAPLSLRSALTPEPVEPQVLPKDTVASKIAEEVNRDESGEKPKTHTKSSAELRSADAATHRLFEGTVLETVLTNRLTGEFSGPVNCLLSTNVYSHNRQHLLIPQGSRVLGEVKRVSNFGQQRLAVVFHRLIMPDGYSLDLDQFQGLNQIGETGLKDQINHHYVEIFGSSLALGALAGFSEAGTTGGFAPSGIDSYRQGFASSVSQSSQRILDKFLNQLPTITIREGYRVKVYLAGDLLVPDYGMHRVQDDL